jgi:hypothetical protein
LNFNKLANITTDHHETARPFLGQVTIKCGFPRLVYQPVEQQTINVAIGVFADFQCFCFNGTGSPPKLNNEIAVASFRLIAFIIRLFFMDTAFNPILL